MAVAGSMADVLPIHQAACIPLNLDALRRELENGVAPDVTDRNGYTPLHHLCGGAVYANDAERVLDDRVAGIRLLITKGAAVDMRDNYNMRPLDYVLGYRRICLILLRAGAALPAHSTDAYLQKVRAAGSLQNYERAHLDALAASFAPKFAHLLPPELVRRVVEYAFHVGDY